MAQQAEQMTFNEGGDEQGDVEVQAEKDGASSPCVVTWEEKLTKAKEFKAQGNENYKAKAYKPAIGKYHRALLYLKGIVDAQQSKALPVIQDSEEEASNKPPEEVMKEVYKLQVDCYNNLSACILHTEHPLYNKVVTYCDKVLELDADNTKALYRKGVSLYHLKNYDGSQEALTRAQSQPEGDKDNNIRRYLTMCAKELARQEAHMKKTYQNMFGRMAAENNSTQERERSRNSECADTRGYSI